MMSRSVQRSEVKTLVFLGMSTSKLNGETRLQLSEAPKPATVHVSTVLILTACHHDHTTFFPRIHEIAEARILHNHYARR